MGTPRLGHIVMFRPHYEEKLTVDNTGFAGGQVTAIHYEGERYHSVNLVVVDKEGVKHERHSIRLLKEAPHSQQERPYAVPLDGFPDSSSVLTPAEPAPSDPAKDALAPIVEVPTPPATPVLEPSSDPAAEHAVDPPSVPADPGATAADAELDEGE